MTLLSEATFSSNARGRPREFDVNEALDRAIPVFSMRGYHGTSISDLAEGMQLTVGSIYKAFKDKRGVFLAALDRQDEVYGVRFRKAIDKCKTGQEKLRAALMFYVELSQGAQGLQGCLSVSTAVELTHYDAAIAERVKQSFRQRQMFLATLIREGQKDGSISKQVDIEGAAWCMLSLFQGLRVIGKTGVSRKDLQATVETAMRLVR